MNQLDEELEARGDPDDRFNGSANGVYQPLPTNLSLPLPVQTPREQEYSEPREHSQNSWRREGKSQKMTNTSSNPQDTGPKIQTQVTQHKSEEHLLDSPDLMSGTRDRIEQHTRTQQDGVVPECEEGIPVEENNLITFTPIPGL